jgi:YHS domain-containing protein
MFIQRLSGSGIHLSCGRSKSRKGQIEVSGQGDNRTMQLIEEHDPVCGMEVDPSKAAASVEYQGATIQFCSQGCAAKFRAAPEKYSSTKPKEAPSNAPAKTEPHAEFTCPMHPEIKHTGPGSCPKCGMALEPVTVTAPAKHTEYTCPMHPQIVRPGPGSCPICGMALEPREITAEDLRGILRARHLSKSTMRNIRENLFFAFFYNAVGIPLAAGVLFPAFGLLLNPMIAEDAMSFSSVSVIANALRLRMAKI